MTVDIIRGSNDDEAVSSGSGCSSLISALSVRKTPYGGRGYFASRDVPANTVILECKQPFTYVVFKSFKKEVCAQCFSYDNGKTRKFKLSPPAATGHNNNRGAYGGVYFCTDHCRDIWSESYDYDGLLSRTLEKVELVHIQLINSKARRDDSASTVSDYHIKSHEDLDIIWKNIENDCNKNTNSSHKLESCPPLDDVEYDTVRLIILVLVQKYRFLNSDYVNQAVEECHSDLHFASSERSAATDISADDSALKRFETGGDSFRADADNDINDELDWSVNEIRQADRHKQWKEFSQLQSNELDHLKQFPAFLGVYRNVYNFLQRILDNDLRHLCDAQIIRDTVGREAGNAFGIWELPMMMESECFGTAVYPDASFFNHQCQPSVSKRRIKNTMVFTTIRDIRKDEQLFISYGMMESLKYEERKKILNEQWHFECECNRCLQDMNDKQ